MPPSAIHPQGSPGRQFAGAYGMTSVYMTVLWRCRANGKGRLFFRCECLDKCASRTPYAPDARLCSSFGMSGSGSPSGVTPGPYLSAKFVFFARASHPSATCITRQPQHLIATLRACSSSSSSFLPRDWYISPRYILSGSKLATTASAYTAA